MKVNFKNVSYPKPIFSNFTDDYINNNFVIEFTNQEYDKDNQVLNLLVKVTIDNDVIKNLINQGKLAVILHLEQKTLRDPKVLNLNEETSVSIDLWKYSTSESIEVVGILFCKESFILTNNEGLNEIYSLLGEEVVYERGDIIGYSNELDINLPEDKRIGSIFNVIKDVDNTLNGQPMSVSLNGTSDLIQILMNSELHEKYVSIYKKDAFVKKVMFFSLVEPALVTAFTEMFLSYEVYKDKKWCRTLALKIEKKLKVRADEIFNQSNYDLNKVYEFVNCALGDLYKDAVTTYALRVGE